MTLEHPMPWNDDKALKTKFSPLGFALKHGAGRNCEIVLSIYFSCRSCGKFHSVIASWENVIFFLWKTSSWLLLRAFMSLSPFSFRHLQNCWPNHSWSPNSTYSHWDFYLYMSTYKYQRHSRAICEPNHHTTIIIITCPEIIIIYIIMS